jgi:O-glycosyl hydrolase
MRRLILICAAVPALAFAQTVTVDSSIKFQTIDGFGTCLGSSEPSNALVAGSLLQ